VCADEVSDLELEGLLFAACVAGERALAEDDRNALELVLQALGLLSTRRADERIAASVRHFLDRVQGDRIDNCGDVLPLSEVWALVDPSRRSTRCAV
jgi:hypothetical protein